MEFLTWCGSDGFSTNPRRWWRLLRCRLPGMTGGMAEVRSVFDPESGHPLGGFSALSLLIADDETRFELDTFRLESGGRTR